MHSGEDFSSKILQEMEEKLLHTFKDKELLKTAFTHRTYANEHGGRDNERLEFLGDAVLELIATEMLFKSCPSDEGELTKLRQQYVYKDALEEGCERASLMQYLRFCGGENNIAGKTKSNVFEAVLGVLYLDGGLEAARAFCEKYLKFTEKENFKSLLQEFVQEREKTTPVYVTREEGGKFHATVTALGKCAEGEGTSKQAAEASAAGVLYKKLKEGRR